MRHLGREPMVGQPMENRSHVGHAARIRLAAAARVCLPTVDRALRGERIRGDAGTRIREAIVAAGLAPSASPSTPPPSAA
jgi:hypothetical protein